MIKKKTKVSSKKTTEEKIKTKSAKVKKRKRDIIIAPAEVCFWVWNGPALQSLLDLRDAFKTLSKEQYLYHANKEKNDFSSWVSAILKDEPCAKDLMKAKNMKGALGAVEKHLAEYNL